jgi:hypothetical protein
MGALASLAVEDLLGAELPPCRNWRLVTTSCADADPAINAQASRRRPTHMFNLPLNHTRLEMTLG